MANITNNKITPPLQEGTLNCPKTKTPATHKKTNNQNNKRAETPNNTPTRRPHPKNNKPNKKEIITALNELETENKIHLYTEQEKTQTSKHTYSASKQHGLDHNSTHYSNHNNSFHHPTRFVSTGIRSQRFRCNIRTLFTRIRIRKSRFPKESSH